MCVCLCLSFSLGIGLHSLLSLSLTHAYMHTHTHTRATNEATTSQENSPQHFQPEPQAYRVFIHHWSPFFYAGMSYIIHCLYWRHRCVQGEGQAAMSTEWSFVKLSSSTVEPSIFVWLTTLTGCLLTRLGETERKKLRLHFLWTSRGNPKKWVGQYKRTCWQDCLVVEKSKAREKYEMASLLSS